MESTFEKLCCELFLMVLRKCVFGFESEQMFCVLNWLLIVLIVERTYCLAVKVSAEIGKYRTITKQLRT